MVSNNNQKEYLEIYRQRYETFRHLDKLFWQMLQIAIAAGSIILAFGDGESSEPEWWALISIGLILIMLGSAMLKIFRGRKKNGKVLHKAGIKIGDKDIPIRKSNWKSASYWTALGVIMVGTILFLIGLSQ